jgi:2-oxo-4-hydroxy-4-carboxy-5-ureidoimidazoline decarboxylase
MIGAADWCHTMPSWPIPVGEHPAPSWLQGLNHAGADELPAYREALAACCASSAWIDAIVGAIPYPDVETLYAASAAATLELNPAGLAQALAAHPRIGERAEPDHGATGRAAWSAQEQSGLASAGDTLRQQLAAANVDYEERFGHVYLVCATGKSGDELLAIARARLANDDVTEDAVVRAELAKIARIRLAKILYPEENS